jgi:hypothetical protein
MFMAGWTEPDGETFGGNGVLGLTYFKRTVTAGNVGDTSADVTIGSFEHCSAVAFRIVAGAALSGTTQAATTSGGGTAHTGLPMTTLDDGALVFECSLQRAAAGTPPATDAYQAAATNADLIVATQTQATAGTTTGRAFTSVTSESNYPQITFALI